MAAIRWANLIEARSRARVATLLGRLLLLLLAVEVLSMPVTQHLWTWDGFLRGGHDFELTLFLTVSCLCLVLWCAHHRSQSLRLLLAICGFHRAPAVGRTGRAFRGEPALIPGMIAPGSGSMFLGPLFLRI